MAAALALTVLLALLAVFQLALALGAPLGHFAWGGAHRVLPRRLRIGSLVSIVIYAVNVGLVSAMEVVLFRHSYRSGLLRRQPPPDVYRFGVLMSLSPVLFFALSIPVAFASTTVAVCFWFLGIPLAAVAERWKPEGAEELLFG